MSTISTYFKDWWKLTNKQELADAQQQLLQHGLPFLLKPDTENRSAHISKIYIDENTYLNELSITSKHSSISSPTDSLLMVHGYGAGVGVFCRNYNQLTNVRNSNIQLYSIDLLGHSLSSPTKFNFKDKDFRTPKINVTYSDSITEDVSSAVDESKLLQDKTKVPINNEKNIASFEYKESPAELLDIAESTAATIKNYEDYYIDSIEKWRILKKLGKINLLGHSLGAYLTFAYTCKYPENVKNLILVSPVGVERSLFSISSLKYHAKHNITKDIKPSEDRASYDHTGKFVRMPTFFLKVWDSAFMPFPLLRGLGPAGVYLASRYTSFRYNQGATDIKELILLQRYALASFWRQSSTEKAISRILSPIVTARDPILDKLERFGLELNFSGKKFPRTLWIYGDRDWMDLKAGRSANDYINKEKLGGESSLEVIPDSGHNVFLDNPTGFNSSVKKFLEWT